MKVRLAIATVALLAIGCDTFPKKKSEEPDEPPHREVVVCDVSRPTDELLQQAWKRWLDGRRLNECDEIILNKAYSELRSCSGKSVPPPPKGK